MLGLVAAERFEPGVAQPLTAAADPLPEAIIDAVGDEELGVLRPAVGALGEANFLLAQGFAVGRAGVLLVGGPPADVAVDDDQRGAIGRRQERREGLREQIEVVGVADAGDIPAIR